MPQLFLGLIALLLFLIFGAVALAVYLRRARTRDIVQDQQCIEFVEGRSSNVEEQAPTHLGTGLSDNVAYPPAPRVNSVEYGLQLIGDADQVFPLDKLPVIIGRAKDNDVILSDTSVSNMHARICFDERLEAICIEDLDSLNGIYLHGRPTSKNVLDDGTKITLGNVTLTFRNMGYIHPQPVSRRGMP